MSDDARDPVLPVDPDLTRAPARFDDAAGELLGPYRLLQQVGEGGMGQVWLAEQTRPVRRQVALKIIKAGMDSAQVIARFEAERQALALMNHPSIAGVFDAGTTPHGRPYFAMEYVKGEPITAYCDRYRLSTKERLDLFISVCEGVQHAHQKGIIHRDLKSSNVLITVQDDHPVPKIIDFGVAKATTGHLAERTIFTEFGVLVGTPEYMSPEQAELTGLDIDTRTDVYSLGVLLYELLTGALPFDGRALRDQALDEIRRTIREVDPPRPSTRVTQLGPALVAVARSRHTEPARLANELKGDLDWVTMKALEKDRTRRYDTATSLAGDLRRHLNHEPVVARPPSALYRTGKFIRRHRFGVTAAAAVGVLLVAFAVTMALQARRIAVERDRANREADTASRVSQFLVGLFELSKPSEKAANSVTAREVLDAGAVRVQQDLQAEPEIKAALLETMGGAYYSLGLFARAEELQRQTLDMNLRRRGEQSTEAERARVALATTLDREARYTEAEALARQAVAARRGAPDEPALLPDALAVLGSVLTNEARLDEAQRNIQEACALYRKVPNISDRKLADCASTLGALLFQKADLTGAERAFRETLDIRRREYGPNHTRTVSATANLASVWTEQGQYAKAEALQREVIRLKRQQLGPDHPDLATSLNNLGATLFFQRKYVDAEASYRDALAIDRHAYGELNPSLATDLMNIGQALAMQGKYGEAEPPLREALEIERATRGNDHPGLALGMTFLADCLCKAARLDEAEATAREALQINLARLGNDHARTKESKGALACALVKHRKFAEAEPLLLDYVGALQAGPGVEGDLRQAVQEVVDMYTAWGRPEQAAAWRAKLPPR